MFGALFLVLGYMVPIHIMWERGIRLYENIQYDYISYIQSKPCSPIVDMHLLSPWSSDGCSISRLCDCISGNKKAWEWWHTIDAYQLICPSLSRKSFAFLFGSYNGYLFVYISLARTESHREDFPACSNCTTSIKPQDFILCFGSVCKEVWEERRIFNWTHCCPV